jgi:hypothetical protein
VIYTAVAVLFFLICGGLGAAGGISVARPRLTVLLAVAMVAAQLALLLFSR